MQTEFSNAQIQLLAVAYGRSVEFVETDFNSQLASIEGDAQKDNFIRESVKFAKGMLSAQAVFAWLEACDVVLPGDVEDELKVAGFRTLG